MKSASRCGAFSFVFFLHWSSLPFLPSRLRGHAGASTPAAERSAALPAGDGAKDIGVFVRIASVGTTPTFGGPKTAPKGWEGDMARCFTRTPV